MPAEDTLGRAKLNLYLDVLGRRADGDHALETLFVSLNWGDTVHLAIETDRVVERAADVAIELAVVGNPAVPAGEDNLAVRAARLACEALRGHQPLPSRIAITIEKRIPMGGGLGGGSADAAAVLRQLAPPTAAALARQLGADVPFALAGGAAIGRERGDVLEALDVEPAFDVVLISPPVSCDTARVFAGAHERVRPAPRNGLQAAVEALQANDPAALRDAHYNALALSMLRAYPAMRSFLVDVERRLGRAPALSGSGSTLFDIPDRGETPRVMRALDGLSGQRWVVRP